MADNGFGDLRNFGGESGATGTLSSASVVGVAVGSDGGGSVGGGGGIVADAGVLMVGGWRSFVAMPRGGGMCGGALLTFTGRAGVAEAGFLGGEHGVSELVASGGGGFGRAVWAGRGVDGGWSSALGRPLRTGDWRAVAGVRAGERVSIVRLGA